MEENKYPAIFALSRGMVYTVNISQVFGDAYTFDEVIHVLMTASPEDIVNININSDGGNLFSLIALRNAIRSTQASVHMNLIGIAASAGSALFLESAHSYQVCDNSCMMIHNMICGTGYDDTQKIVTRADSNKKINERFVRETYQDFLSETEIEDVIFNSREIYLEDHEIRERLEARENKRREQATNALQQALEDSDKPLSQDDLQELTDEDLEYDLKEIDNVRKVYLSEIKKRKTKK